MFEERCQVGGVAGGGRLVGHRVGVAVRVGEEIRQYGAVLRGHAVAPPDRASPAVLLTPAAAPTKKSDGDIKRAAGTGYS